MDLREDWLNEIVNNKTSLGFDEWKSALNLTGDRGPVRHLITLDMDLIAKEMKEQGITSTEEGWTDTLMDILEDQYGIETVTRIKMFGK